MSENSKGLTYEKAHAAKPVGYIFKSKVIVNTNMPEMQDHITLGVPQNPDHVGVYHQDVVGTLKGQVSELEERLEGYKTALESMQSKYEAERQRQFTEAGWFFPRVWITDSDASTLNETIELTKRAPNVYVKLGGFGVTKDKEQFPAAWIKNGFYVEPAPMPNRAADPSVESGPVTEVNLPEADAKTSSRSDKIATLFDAIKHGDEAHQAWLKEAITAHFAGLPVPDVVLKGAEDQKWVVQLGAAVGRLHEPFVIEGLKNEKLDEIYKRLMTDIGMPNSHSLLGAFKQLVNEITQGGASLADIVHLAMGEKTVDQVFWGEKAELTADSAVKQVVARLGVGNNPELKHQPFVPTLVLPSSLQQKLKTWVGDSSISAAELGIDSKRLGRQAGYAYYNRGRLCFYDMADTRQADIEVFPIYFEEGRGPKELSSASVTKEQVGLGTFADLPLPPSQIQTGVQLNAYIDYMRMLESAIDTYVSSSLFAQANENNVKEVRANMMKYYLDLWLKENIPAEKPETASQIVVREPKPLTGAEPLVNYTGVRDTSESGLPKPVYSKEALNDPTNIQKAAVMWMVGTEEQKQEAHEFLKQHLGR